MSKEANLAIAMIAARMGQNAEAEGYISDTDAEHDVALYREATYYGPIAAAMVDAAFTITFKYPDNYEWWSYGSFGETLTDHMSSSSEGHDLPPRSDMLDVLAEAIYNNFKEVAMESQYASLRNVIAQVQQDAA